MNTKLYTKLYTTWFFPLVLIILFFQKGYTQSNCREADSLTLIALHNELTFSWDISDPMTDWYGVTLNSDGCVVSLSASASGGVMPEEIGNLEALTYLDFSESNLAGRIPGSLTSLSNLEYLNLSQNDLEGALPTDISSLSNLEYLDISDNHFNNAIPAGLWELNNLEYLYISGNPMLIGTIPPEVNNLTNLKQLIISGTSLLGTLPPEIGSLLQLEALFLENNKLSGSIPSEIGNLTNLNQLQLAHNGLTGSIPAAITNLTNLQSLYLNSNVLSGTVPDLSGMTSLNTFAIGDNNFTFSGIEENLGFPSFTYAPQDSIELTLSDNILTAEAGAPGPFGANAYNWYHNNVLIAVTTDENTLEITESGVYRCKVINSPITKPNIFGQDLTLTSKAVYFDQFLGAMFPGDINHDGIADIADVLPWGLAFGNTGLPRPDASPLWIPQESNDWSFEVGNVNGKYIDCNGDGVINESDIDIIMDNYGQTYPYQELVYDNKAARLYTRYTDLEIYPDSFVVHLNVLLEGQAEAAVDLHGVSFEIEYRNVIGDGIEHLYAVPNTSDSWMGTSGSNLTTIHKNIESADKTDIAVTRNDGQNIAGMGEVCSIRMVFGKDAGIYVPDDFLVDLKNIKLMDAAGNTYKLSDDHLSIFGMQNIEQIEGLTYCVNSTDATCFMPGSAEAVVINPGTASYTYAWSNGINISTIENLESGLYTLTLSDNTGQMITNTIEIQGTEAINVIPTINHTTNNASNGSIELTVEGGDGDYSILWDNGQTGALAENLSIGEHSVVITDGTNCVETFDFFIGEAPVPFTLRLLLQGAYNESTQLMSDALRERNLVPTVDPYVNNTEAPPAAFSNTGDDAIVDWLWVELRDNIDPVKKQAEKMVFVQRDGDIVDIDGVSTPEFEGILHGLYNLVIQHRNHLPVMSPAPFLLNEGGLIYDFSQQDSYTGAAGFGQLELSPGIWVMYGGDGDQTFEIAGTDKTIWTFINGNFGVYQPADYNLDGDAAGSDKSIWFNNNGISSRVPKVE